MKFAEKLYSSRKAIGFTQEQVANAIGISKRAYINYETNGAYPRDREIYHKLAKTLMVEVNYLLTEDEEFITEAKEQYGFRGSAQAKKLLAQAGGLFAGGELSDTDKDALMLALQKAFWDAKEHNQVTYTSKKEAKTSD